MVWEIHTETTIEADAAAVWRVLTDFSAYDEWNPTLVRARGSAEIGERLRLYHSVPTGLGVPFRPRVTVVEPERELRWRVTVGSVLAAEHVVSIVPTDGGGDRVRLVQREEVEGPLAVPAMGLLGGAIRDGLEAMNDALATRVEARTGDID